MSDFEEKSDIEKPVEAETAAEPAATSAAAATTTTAAANGGKSPTFLDKLSRFTIGSNRGELPAEQETGEGEKNAPPPVPLTKWQKVKRHYRRFWICYLIALIIILAIILPCTFLLIIPRIAQDLLDSGSIVINNASILQPTNESIVLSISSNIYVPGPFTVHTSAEHLQMYVPQVGSEYPMALLNLPKARVHKNTTIGETGQFTPFENYSSWQEFVHNTIFLDDGSLGLKGSIGTRLGKIKEFTLNLDKTVPSKGLNKFNGFTIDSAQLVLPAESDGTNLLANATLPNQSILTLEIGNTTVDILAGDLVIGTGSIQNLLLTPGNNTVQIRGTANLTTILDNLSSIISNQSSYIKNGYLALTTKVTDISYNGSTVPYYTEEMGKISLTAETPILGLLLNTLKGYLGSGAANGTNLTSILDNSTEDDAVSSSDSSKSIRDVLQNHTEFEVIARRHLEKLVKL